MSRNTRYFFQETGAMMKGHLTGTLMSILSIGMIFMVFGLILFLSQGAQALSETIRDEVTIGVFVTDASNRTLMEDVRDQISQLDGVKDVRMVAAEEAILQMETVLGDEKEILSLLPNNPFVPYIEVSLQPELAGQVVDQIGNIKFIDYVRDNREVIQRLTGLLSSIRLLSFVLLIGTFLTTLIIVSHMIRQSVYLHRVQLRTLALLGAPKHFIELPIYLLGTFMALAGSILGAVLSLLLMGRLVAGLKSALGFLPLPQMGQTGLYVILGMLALALVLGLLGAFNGLRVSKRGLV